MVRVPAVVRVKSLGTLRGLLTVYNSLLRIPEIRKYVILDCSSGNQNIRPLFRRQSSGKPWTTCRARRALVCPRVRPRLDFRFIRWKNVSSPPPFVQNVECDSVNYLHYVLCIHQGAR